MSNNVKRLLAAILVVALSVVGVIVFTLPHWWYRVGEGQSRTSYGPLGTVTVYKSTEGNVLLLIREDSLIDQYIFYPSSGKIGIPNHGQFVYFRFVAYSKDVPVPVVFSDDRIKVETDMNIIVENGILRFRTRTDRQVEANLNFF
jgi:hypothetical protein